MATVKENLIAAKALIDTPEKWGKGKHRHDGKRCALVALDHAGGKLSEHRALSDVLPDMFLGTVVEFNDHPDTTHADIMALFQRAIDAEEKKEARS